MKLFIAIFAATLVLAPALAVAFYLLAAVVHAGGSGSPQLADIAKLIRDSGTLLLSVAYFLGGLPAAAGGAFLGWRFTRKPPRLGLGAPLALGGVLGLLVVPVLTGFRPTLSAVSLAGIVAILGMASAAGCWAAARLIYRAMRPATDPTAGTNAIGG